MHIQTPVGSAPASGFPAACRRGGGGSAGRSGALAAVLLGLALGLPAQSLPELAAAPATAAPLPAAGPMQVYGVAGTADPVGPGDLLDVRIFGQPQLSGSLRVGPDGAIAPPFVPSLAVAGETPLAIEAQLTHAYDAMLTHPLVSVRLEENNSRRVAINGEVPRPGMYAFSGQLSLLQALALAGGVDPVKASQRIFLFHQPPATRSLGRDGTPTFSINSVLETIDLRQLPTHPELNRILQPGDAVDVPEAHQVYISGDIMHPGAAALLPGLSLGQLITEEGGFLPQADTGHVRLLRLQPDGISRRAMVVDVRAIQHNRAADVPLEADDIVQVSGSPLRMAGLELLDFFTGTERWRVQSSVASKVP